MATAEFDVTTIGNAIVDVLATTDDAFLERHGLVKGSMRLIEPEEAERLYADMGPAVEISGGSAANTAFGVGSFGGRAAYIGKVADDQFGRVFRHDIRANGIAFDTDLVTSGQPTARSFILVTPDGERTMNTALGACQELSPDDVPEDLIRRSRIVYLEGYLFDREDAKRAFYRAADLARSAGGKVSLTLSDSFCVDRYRAEFIDLIRSRVDILFANTQELTALYQTGFAAACDAVRKDVALAAVTCSEMGSLILAGPSTVEISAEPIEALVDTTGAGDLYASGFLFGIARNAPPAICGRLASLAASEVIGHIGARPQHSLSAIAKSAGISL